METSHMLRGPAGRWKPIAFLVLLATTSSAAKAGLEREFVWESFGESETLHVRVPETLHDHYSAKKRHYNYPNYVLEDEGYELSAGLAKAFEHRAEEQGWDEWELLNAVVDFVQSLDYQSETGEYPKYPVETLMDGGGDCEDTAILLAAILDKLSVNCVLLSPPGHMAVGVALDGMAATAYSYNGRKYYYVETTGKGWKVGAIPKEYAGKATVWALPENTAPRRIITTDETIDAEDEEGSMLTNYIVAFSREHTLQLDPETKQLLYKFGVHIIADEEQLKSIKEVQYRLMASNGDPDPKQTWMRAYDFKNGFSQEWTGTSYRSVQVRFYLKDGTMFETQMNIPAEGFKP